MSDTHPLVGEQVKVCHQKGRITDYLDERAFYVHIQIGGVNQDILITEKYAEGHVVKD